MKQLLVFVCGFTLLFFTGCQPLSPPPNGPVPPVAYFATAQPSPTITPTAAATATLMPTPTAVALDGPVHLLVTTGVPDRFASAIAATLADVTTLSATNGPQPLTITDAAADATTLIAVTSMNSAQAPLLERMFAVVAPFDTVQDSIQWNEVQLRWMGLGDTPLLTTDGTLELLTPLIGEPSVMIVPRDELADRLEATPGTLAIVPFDELDPRLKVLTVGGEHVLSNQFDPNHYPLAVALTVQGKGAPLLAQLLQPVAQQLAGGYTNRDSDRLTSLIMTGVTAMSRGTAARMERNGPLYPAAVISDTLRAADITHISNEVPFLDDCQVDNSINNLTLCSHTDYWAALEAVGADIIGLSGNHVNDFGRDGARRSLQFYTDNEIPIYGSGLTVEAACAPLLWEDHGNTFAFFAALAFGPSTAWVTAEEPGACYYYEHKDEILAAVAEAAKTADIVSVELQYLETYQPYPTPQQVIEFRELRAAGAELVTGVQSHVPQSMEPYGSESAGGPGMIVYGLGNLFFDQMWSWETRTELMARHAIYGGRVIGTEILTAVLEDYSQPRWADERERTEILTRIFRAAPARPVE